jgi:uncharacterized RDD family membrane protein YckC
VEASAAQNTPVTKTCLQCGAVLPSSVPACEFCDATFSENHSLSENDSIRRAPNNPPLRSRYPEKAQEQGRVQPSALADDTAWRDELNSRVQAYRARRRKSSTNQGQSRLPFDDSSQTRFVTVEDSPETSARRSVSGAQDDFAFTIAIGRPSAKRIQENERMVIDVSLQPQTRAAAAEQSASDVSGSTGSSGRLQRAASLDDRRIAALVDGGCLLFAYGAFLALFGSLGGQLTISKISAAVYFATFAFVYVQYFGLFTIFGGTTPGMMVRGLQIINFSGETPTPQQLFLRTAGYLLSAGSFFLGFLWAMWDEDELTWHDRLSHTYLSPVETFVEMEASEAVQGS